MDVEVQLFHEPDRDEELDGQFGMKVVRCRQRAGLIGEEYWGTFGKRKVRTPSFPWLATQVYPDSLLEDWR